MLFVMLAAAVLIFAYALFNPKQDWVWYSALMLVALLGAVFFYLFYSSRTVFRYSIYPQIMGISRAYWRWMILSPISERAILSLLNASVVLFLFASQIFGLSFSGFLKKRLFQRLVICSGICLAVEWILYDPMIVKALYYAAYPSLTTPSGFTALQAHVNRAFRILNAALLLVGAVVMFMNLFQTMPVRVLRIPVISVTMLYCVAMIFFLILLGDLPAFATQNSKIANLTYYRALPAAFSPPQTAWVLTLLMGITLLYLASLFLYSWYEIHMSTARHDFHKRLDMASVTARMFCHYMKNEVLALRADVETGQASPTAQGMRDALDSIDERLEAIFDRLNSVHERLQKIHLLLSPISVAALARGAVKAVRKDIAPARVQLELLPEETWVLADEYYLGDALAQLLLNAAEAMRHLPAEEQIIRLSCQSTPRWVRILVSDRGAGIPGATRSNLFKPFYSTKPTSSHWGVGLATCYSIVAAHDGRISVDSKEGEGATFLILLPAVPDGIRNTLNRPRKEHEHDSNAGR